jgi:chaperonin GroEL
MRLDTLEVEVLGSAKKAVVERELTTIYSEASKPNLAYLPRLLDNPELTLLEKEEIQERVCRLSGNVIKINVGAHTELERSWKKERYQQAINSIRCAIAGGAVCGGGIALALASRILDNCPAGLVLKSACLVPAMRIIANSGLSPRPVIDAILSGRQKGFDAAGGRYTDLVSSGIIDANRTAKFAIESAVSMASTFIATDCVVTLKTDHISGLPPGIESVPRIAG